ncbi:MAG: hypothetical protein GY811_29080 [Myxococcales bacterium]|nr:hypothetical protein [Myxococcales bacterium]
MAEGLTAISVLRRPKNSIISTRTSGVANTGSMMSLSQIMGHSSVEVTERYARLLPGHYRESEYAMLDLDLRADTELAQPSAKLA